jgi:PAS domain S-box-containing protein
MNRLNLSLKTKMAVTVSALVVSLVMAMGVFVISYFHGEFKETIAKQQFTLVTALADRMDQEIVRSRREIAEIAEGIPLDMLKDKERAQRFLDSRGKGELNYDHGLVLLTNSGKVIAVTPLTADRQAVDYSSRDYFKEVVATAKPYISAPHLLSKTDDQPVITFAAPIFDAEGRVQAVLAGHVEHLNDGFLGNFSRIPIGKTGHLSLFTADLTTIMHPDRTRIMKKELVTGANRLLARAVAGFEGSGERVNVDGIAVLTSVKRLKSTNWLLTANYPLAEAYAPFRMAKWYFLVGLALLGISSVLLVWFLMKRMTAPLLLFTRHVAEMTDKGGIAQPIDIATGDEIGALAEAFNGMVRELDEQQVSLQMNAELYRIVAEFTSEMAIWRAPDKSIIYISPNCRSITGYEDSDFYRSPALLDGIVHPDDRHLWVLHKDEAGENGTHRPIDYRIVTKDDEVRWLNHSCHPVTNDRGDFQGVRGSYRDITERIRAEQALKATQAQMLQSEKMASIGQLAAGVAHEINNPIGFVASNLGTLDKYVTKMVDFLSFREEKLRSSMPPHILQELEDEKKRLKLDYIVKDAANLIHESLEGTDRVRKIVQDLKTFSRTSETEHKPADINECLESSINIAWNEIKYKATLNREYGEIPRISCNPQELAQVFLNLLVNAGHAIDKQGVITVRTWSADGSVHVAISDTGCGIPGDILPRIFEPFFTTKEVGLGTGLGLSISYGIVEKHNGEILVQSEVGTGTTFTVRLPVVESVGESG